ncbi:hypothetical protein PR048_023533 [Dryococelus australis]|uniref:Uncharacterized protein n=1 Tax=Dryococelus australis TaxID=614101 RepID=A0ABQ9GUD9_9NEOP|nr:hypothetical protein PR048_023533 [Dryococelus australis]
MHFKGKEYLLLVDSYSKYPELSLLRDLSSSHTISCLKESAEPEEVEQEPFNVEGQFTASSMMNRGDSEGSSFDNQKFYDNGNVQLQNEFCNQKLAAH